MRLDRVAHPLREGNGSVDHCPGQEEHEFLAAVASNVINLTRLGLEDLRELAQHLVSGLMPVRIVHALEAVEIEHDA